MYRKDWQATVNGVKKSQTQLSNDTTKSHILSVWSVGNLTSTALGPLQSETSASGHSGEQIQEQMGEKNLYDNIGDEEEKQSIKMESKGQKDERSQEQIFLVQPTAPLVKPPPFNPESPWDDGFAFKPQITVPDKMTPVQKGVLWHSFRGVKTLFLPVAVTQIPPELRILNSHKEESTMIIMPYLLKP